MSLPLGYYFNLGLEAIKTEQFDSAGNRLVQKKTDEHLKILPERGPMPGKQRA